ncbi:hypothetical protein A3K21_03330 [Candidatus Roizmanbacteria bacterium RIFOXYC1_FULL_38_14]|uniref:Uncharacterized protein n=1 Tax=Candidatus Roizmanbacteria bacterium RIFOXYD1_FULL_38_12 TaxID=1802093 RepID=A0A1F7L122_9BACT|nr:MAG: hypothetical protein UV23_C0018G0002 [Candidatus Nomurabacteria bacterium GW2011_GWF1_42_40]OGK62597.1 MAG: hypothetical protein A3K47_03325 [Candidatus Roizmanbacteria bacterium RIFOXYA2_FULL_38_14]OGK63796.1 MAG: hypothetical protein A3K27_03325 [Candidatus Roizmanbacteria bacterium RIFOXYA1_FULL_37_12]OGK65642.1 MAG: hypothetical protein A3K38_03325 [Candidatus Roizmanbacteria bacterium RIFOXYB1_FULL_40_23]OGK70047.1 MAG: hypothetical protein A3K21_03330 [Candidatus Roizmanbacteria b
MRLSKKMVERGRRKIQQDLFFGRKSFRKFKETTNTFLQDSSQMWENLPQPITKKDKEYREGVVGIASLGSVFLARIREAEAYRKSIKFRNCTYRKYVDVKKGLTIYACSFFKISENINKTSYFCITNKKYKGGLKAKLVKTEMDMPKHSIERGRFRYSPHSFTEFNLFLYPKFGKKYGYKFIGKKNTNLYVQSLTNEKQTEGK